jgi:predicted hydrocarbon binding protein
MLQRKILDKKTSYCIQRIFIEKGVKFYYARMILNDLEETIEVLKIMRDQEIMKVPIKIKFGTFSSIGENETKWTFTFSAPGEVDIREFINKLQEKTKIRPATTWQQDIIYLADDYGNSPEYPIIGYFDLDPDSAHTMILSGGLWHRMMKSMDTSFGDEGTDIVMFNAGNYQGWHMAEEKKGLGDIFKIPKNVSDKKFKESVVKLFRGYGYCDIENIEVDIENNKVQKLVIRHSAFTISNFKPNEVRKCHFQKGIFNGFFSHYQGTVHKFTEIECMGEGQAQCVYINES